jgi:6-phosphofructokinase 2
MALIATLTLNPALDCNTTTPEVRPTHKLRCTTPSYEAGGGGINVARAIHALGGEVSAVFPCGGPAGTMIRTLLDKAGVPNAPVAIAGHTRESFTVDEEGGEQYRFVLPGPELSADELQAVLDQLKALGSAPAVVVASGSLPPGCDTGIFKRLGDLCRTIDARLIIDTSGPALAACEGTGAYLIKPSIREVEDLLGRTLEDETDEMAAAHELRTRGLAEVVVMSLDERGALLAAAEGEFRLPAAPVPPGGGTVGAGDAMVAALSIALARNQPLDEALRFGVAAGAAALLTPAAELVRREDVERLYAATDSPA